MLRVQRSDFGLPSLIRSLCWQKKMRQTELTRPLKTTAGDQQRHLLALTRRACLGRDHGPPGLSLIRKMSKAETDCRADQVQEQSCSSGKRPPGGENRCKTRLFRHAMRSYSTGEGQQRERHLRVVTSQLPSTLLPQRARGIVSGRQWQVKIP